MITFKKIEKILIKSEYESFVKTRGYIDEKINEKVGFFSSPHILKTFKESGKISETNYYIEPGLLFTDKKIIIKKSNTEGFFECGYDKEGDKIFNKLFLIIKSDLTRFDVIKHSNKGFSQRFGHGWFFDEIKREYQEENIGKIPWNVFTGRDDDGLGDFELDQKYPGRSWEFKKNTICLPTQLLFESADFDSPGFSSSTARNMRDSFLDFSNFPHVENLFCLFEDINLLILKDLKEEIDRLDKPLMKKYTDDREGLIKIKTEISNELDKNNNGIPDILESSPFDIMFEKNQKLITDKEKEFSDDFCYKFVKLSSFLCYKKESIIEFYSELLSNIDLFLEIDFLETVTMSESDLCDSIEVAIDHQSYLDKVETINKSLQDQIHLYNQLLLHSLNMISCLLDNKRILFYKIYNIFDEYGVFNSALENLLSQQLENINTNLIDVSEGISKMDKNMTRGFNVLTRSVDDMNQSVNKHLKNMNSKLIYSNLVQTINTYQNYRSRQELKK